MVERTAKAIIMYLGKLCTWGNFWPCEGLMPEIPPLSPGEHGGEAITEKLSLNCCSLICHCFWLKGKMKRPIFPRLKKCHINGFFKIAFCFSGRFLFPLLVCPRVVILPHLGTQMLSLPDQTCVAQHVPDPAFFQKYSSSLSYSPTPVMASSQFSVPLVWVLAKAPSSAFSSLPNPDWPCQFSLDPQKESFLRCLPDPAFSLFKIL